MPWVGGRKLCRVCGRGAVAVRCGGGPLGGVFLYNPSAVSPYICMLHY